MTTFMTAFTLLVLISYLLASFDDLIFNLIYLLKYKKLKPKASISTSIDWEEARPIAVMIPAYQEAGVVAPMLESTLASVHYPSSRLHFFVGVYPNDLATFDEVYELSKKHSNIHCVVNSKAGPTCKSQNLNEIFKYINIFERQKNKRFLAVAVHDAEDVIHPYTFKLYNTLLNKHAAVQLPVFPLYPKVNFWQRLITGTYADEFAEHHLHHLPVREHLNMFMPSAGTGFVLRRDILERLSATGPLFNEASLTEDYELALRLWQLGIKVHFHVQKVKRFSDNAKLQDDYVAVREYFPTSLATAIKQKARWTYGITLQTPQLITGQTFVLKDKLALLQDQKAKVSNLVHAFGYPLFAYSIAALFLPLPSNLNAFTLSLACLVLGITTMRLFMRYLAVKAIYGRREAFISAFFLPFLPVKWLLGNLINMLATVRAWRLHFFPAGFKKTNSKVATPKWDKTERKGYVSSDILTANKRRLGDNLLFYNDVSEQAIADLIKQQPNEGKGKKLGQLALDEKLVSDRKLRKRLAELLHVKTTKLELEETSSIIEAA